MFIVFSGDVYFSLWNIPTLFWRCYDLIRCGRERYIGLTSISFVGPFPCNGHIHFPPFGRFIFLLLLLNYGNPQIGPMWVSIYTLQSGAAVVSPTVDVGQFGIPSILGR